MVLNNGSNYNDHFIIKELVNEFEGEFNCQEENTQKYETFSVEQKKKLQESVKVEKKLQKPYLTD